MDQADVSKRGPLCNRIRIAGAESDGSKYEVEEAHHSAILAGHPRRLPASQSRTRRALCLRLLAVCHLEGHCTQQRNPHKCTRNVLVVAGAARWQVMGSNLPLRPPPDCKTSSAPVHLTLTDSKTRLDSIAFERFGRSACLVSESVLCATEQ